MQELKYIPISELIHDDIIEARLYKEYYSALLALLEHRRDSADDPI